MSDPIWRSQVGQDRWAWETLGPGPHTFLDIGCGHTQERSNTWTLETEFGWTGLRVDQGEVHGPARSSPFVRADATAQDWQALLKQHHLWPSVDYLSLDVDEATPRVLAALPFSQGWSFKCATIEHDSYRFGDGPRLVMRSLLLRHGYTLARADVEDQGLKFEDWWVKGTP